MSHSPLALHFLQVSSPYALQVLAGARVTTTSQTIGGVPCLVHRPHNFESKAVWPTLVFFHGVRRASTPCNPRCPAQCRTVGLPMSPPVLRRPVSPACSRNATCSNGLHFFGAVLWPFPRALRGMG